MPVDKQVMLRYQVLNKCFRNRYREYTIDDLVDECNKALRKIDKPDVSLSFGPDVEVISPTVLKEEMKKKISAMCYNYRIDEET